MFSYTSVPQSLKDQLKCRNYTNYVKVLYNDPDPILKNYSPEPCLVTNRFKNFDKIVKEFPVRTDDIWIIGYPKTGNTWTSELISVLLTGMDVDKLQQKCEERVPLLDYFFSESPDFDQIAHANAIQGRRAMRTHLPLNLLPQDLTTSSNHKMIYVTRNPKDAAISWFHYFTNAHGYNGGLENLLDCFIRGENVRGSYFQHVDEYLRLAKIKENLLVVTYESLLASPVSMIGRIADFIGIKLTQADAEKVADFICFDQMKKRECSNMAEEMGNLAHNWGGDTTHFTFLRKGRKDTHKEEMPKEFIERFNEEMKKWPEIMTLYPDF